MKYFQLRDNMRIPERWVLSDPLDEKGHEIDPWLFDEGKPLELQGTPRLTQAQPGRALDFSLTTLSIPVVHARVVALLERSGLQQQVQWIPVQVEGQPEPYFILNALRVIRCIDDSHCEQVQYWRPEDGEPDKVGQYRVVSGLRIDPSRVGDASIFRTWGWSVALIVSETLKQTLQQENISGTRFTQV